MAEEIPFFRPSIGKEEIDEVVDCLNSGWITTGPKVKQFENNFAEFLGVKHSISVNSATAGLHLALDAIGIGPGDKVLTTPFTFTATAEVVRYMGADPVFIDIDPDTLNIDPHKLEEYLYDCSVKNNPMPKAIIPVHFGGQACDMHKITQLAKVYSLWIVEDAAHALPAEHDGRLIGTIGDITVFSFYATKTLVTGEGGMVVTNNSSWAERIKTMRLHGISHDVFDRYKNLNSSWYYEVIAPGFKYNMTDISAAMGLHQLKKIEIFRERRQEIADYYNDRFTKIPLDIPVVSNKKDKHSWHLYVVKVDNTKLNINRDKFINLLAEKGVGTSVHFIPLHIQPYWRDKYKFVPQDYVNAFREYKKVVSLPIYPGLTDAQVEKIGDNVVKIIIDNKKQ